MVDKNDIQEPSCSRRRSVESNLLLNDYGEVAPEYRAIFERLFNKDESLKIQALHKISELVKNDDSKNAKAVLSYWADFYYTLTTDIDHNVREAAQACHGVLVRASGGLSKALQKWLLCDWLVVCCDSHAPTAELARAQLQSTFPGSKLGKAISTCKEEIVKLLFCNLRGSYNIVSRLSESEINNPKCLKDLHSKVKRLILNTLKAVVFLITLIPETETVWWWGQLKELLQSLKIWEFYVDKPKPHREECTRFYFYPHFIWAREKTCRKKINKIVSYIKDIFNTITEKPSLEVYARRCDCLDGNIVCPFKNDNNIIANIDNESNTEQQELTKKYLMLFLYNLICRAVVLREALFKSNVVTYIVVRDEFVMKELNKILHDAAVLNVLSQKYGFWPDYKIIVEGLQLIDVVITNILCMLTAVAKEALSVYFAKNAASRGYYWSYASRLYEEKKKNLKYITPHVALSSSYSENSDNSLDKKFTDAERVISSMETSSLENFIMGIGYMHNLQASHRAAPGTLQLVMLYSVLAAHADRPALCAELYRDWRAGLPPADVIINVYSQYEELMLFSTDLSIAPWSVVVSNAAIVDFLDGEVKKFGCQLLSHQWDFIFETLILLLSSLQLSAYRWDCYKVAIIARAVLTLLGSVYKFVVSPEAQSKSVEWAYTLAPHLTRDLVEFITFVLDREDGPITSCHISTINALIDSFEPLQHFSKLPAHMLRPLCKCVGATMRRRTHPTRKLFAFAVLEFVADLIIFEDAKKLEKWCHDNEFEIPMSEFYFNCLDKDVKHLQDVVNAALPDIESPESTHQLVPGSEVRSAALGLLLLSTHMLRQCARASADQSLSNVAKLYPSLLRGGEFPHRFMLSSVQILLDDEMRDFVRCIRPHDSSSDFMTGLEPLQQVNVYSPFDAYSLGELTRFVLCETLSGETAYDALQWTFKLSSSASAVVQEIVGKVASPVLQHRLLCDLTERKHELSDVDVRVQWWNTSVRCKLQVEDDTLELTLQLAKEHPLKQPTFTTSLSPAPDTCLIAVDLLTKNGTLLNALQTWIGQVIDCVRGATPCYICFDRVHASSGRLPAAPCPQCRNNFHNVCLNRWFRSSRRAKCPLCRSRFLTVPYQEHNTD